MISALADAAFICATRHDSMLVIESDGEMAMGLILSHAIGKVGFKIRFKQEEEFGFRIMP